MNRESHPHTGLKVALGAAAIAVVLVGACGGNNGAGGGGGDDDDGGPSGTTSGPSTLTPEECAATYQPELGSDCSSGAVSCGPAASCVGTPDCATCSDQCLPIPCSTDAECQAQFGDLCPGVVWICDQYLLSTGCLIDFTAVGTTSSSGPSATVSTAASASSGGPTCSTSTGDATCDGCAQDLCCTELEQCTGGTPCEALLACLSTYCSNAADLNACAQESCANWLTSDAIDAITALDSCVCGSCSSSCGSVCF